MKYSISLGRTINTGNYNSVKAEVWHEFDENTNTFAAYGCYQLPLEFVYGAGIFVSAMFAIIFALLFVIGCINEQFDVLNDDIKELKRRK